MWFEQSDVCAATMMPTDPSTRDEFLDGRDVLDVAHARAAVFGREDRAHQPELAQFLDRRQREFAGLVPLHDVRSNLAFGKLAHALLQVQLLFVQLEVQKSSVGSSRLRLRFVILRFVIHPKIRHSS